MKSIFTKIYAWALLIFTIVGMCAVVAVAWADMDNLIAAVVGVALSLLLAPVVHELGHVVFACVNRLEIVYCKCFCFRYFQQQGVKKFGFANPLAADETQVLPRGSEDMHRRAYAFTVGGLIFGGVFFSMLLLWAILAACLRADAFAVYAMLPYTAYLFLLNVLPLQYPAGKTDAMVAFGLKKQSAEEQTMLNVMRIYGELQSGKTYAEIDESLYFSAPQIAMDQPLYLAITDARYRYYVEREEYDKAFDVLKRRKAAGEYMTDEEVLTLECDLAYLCLLGGNDEVLKAAVKNGDDYWKSETVSVLRTLALYMNLCGETERSCALISQAKDLLKTLPTEGQKKHEQLLLSRIK